MNPALIINESDHGLNRRSSSACAKYADALNKLSLAWRSSRFPLLIQHLAILVYQPLLGAIEKVTDFLHNLGDIGGTIVAHAWSSSARATATSVASLPRGPMIEKPSVH